MNELRQETLKIIQRRIVYFVLLICLFNGIDRQNVAFGALQMNKDLHMSSAQFGFGLSTFFIGYSILQIPNGLAFKAFGPRKCLTVILIIWGIVSSAMALCQGAQSFAFLRFLMGCAEAGVPGGIIYLYSNWMPKETRSRAAATNTFAISLTTLLLAGVSGWLLDHPPEGIAGWRWMFLIEGAPAAAVGVATWFCLPDTPREAKFLSPEQKGWLIEELEAEQAVIRAKSSSSFMDMFTDKAVWLLCAVWFSLLLGFTALQLWLPIAIKEFANAPATGLHLSNFQISLVSALPWFGCFAGTFINTWHSDKTQERYWHVGGALMLTALALLFAMTVSSPYLLVLGLIVSAFGLGATHGVFFTLPMSILTGTAAAGGFALINLVGNMSGFVGSNLIGYVRDKTGSFVPAFIGIAIVMVLGTFLLVPIYRIANQRLRGAMPVDAKFGAGAAE